MSMFYTVNILVQICFIKPGKVMGMGQNQLLGFVSQLLFEIYSLKWWYKFQFQSIFGTWKFRNIYYCPFSSC